MHGCSHRQPNIRPRLPLHLRLCHRCFWLKRLQTTNYGFQLMSFGQMPVYQRLDGYSRGIRLPGRPTAVRTKQFCTAAILSTVSAGEIFFRLPQLLWGKVSIIQGKSELQRLDRKQFQRNLSTRSFKMKRSKEVGRLLGVDDWQFLMVCQLNARHNTICRCSN